MSSEAERITARLFVADALDPGAEIRFDAPQTHYLRNVLRLAPGDFLALINGRDGEARARIEGFEKRGGHARIIAITRAFTPEPDLWLLFSPIKRPRQDLLVEKATELGVSRLLPTLTRRTNSDRVSRERLLSIAREATEQCERLTLPEIEEVAPLTQRLADWPAGRLLIVADEAGEAGDALGALTILPPGVKLALLIGPEGGFDPIEREGFKKLAIEEFSRHGASKVNAVSPVSSGLTTDGGTAAGRFVLRVGLGPRILRSDTAAAALLTLVQAQNGDWRNLGPRGRRLGLQG